MSSSAPVALLEAIRNRLLVPGMLRRADLRHTDLSGADLSGQDLSGADLREANLSNTDLRGACLFATNFSSAHMRGALLTRAEASGARFVEADLTGADMRLADLTGADLRSARCVRVQLSGADLSGADCFGALWTDADLRDAEIGDALQLSMRVPDPDAPEPHIDEERAKDILASRVFGLHQRAWAIILAGGELEPALLLLEECCRLVPNYQMLHYSRATLLIRLDRIDEAEAAYRRALELVPDLPEALLDLGRVLVGRGLIEEAVEHLEAAALQYSTAPSARRILAELYSNALEQPRKAIAHLRELILRSRTPEVLEELARLLAETGDFQEAIELFEEVLKHRPEDAFLLRDVGVLYAQSGDVEEAIATLRDALSLDPNIPDVRPHLQALGAFDDEPDADPGEPPPPPSLQELLAQFAPGSYIRSAVALSEWSGHSLVTALDTHFPEHAPLALETLFGPSQDGVLARITSPKGTFVAKGYLEQIVTRPELELRLAFAEHLADRGVPLPRPIRNVEDTCCFATPGAHWMLMPLIEGVFLSRTTIVRKLHACRAAGAALATLHMASLDFPMPDVEFQPRLGSHLAVASSYTASEVLEWRLGRNPGVLTAFRKRPGRHRLVSRIAQYAQVVASMLSELPRGMLHGDPAPRNIIWSEDGTLQGLLDLDLSAPGPLLFDVALLLETIASNMDDIRRSRRLIVDAAAVDALIDGYNSVRPLTTKERMALPSLRRLAFVDRLVDASVLVATEGLPLVGLIFDILESIVMAKRNA